MEKQDESRLRARSDPDRSGFVLCCLGIYFLENGRDSPAEPVPVSNLRDKATLLEDSNNKNRIDVHAWYSVSILTFHVANVLCKPGKKLEIVVPSLTSNLGHAEPIESLGDLGPQSSSVFRSFLTFGTVSKHPLSGVVSRHQANVTRSPRVFLFNGL